MELFAYALGVLLLVIGVVWMVWAVRLILSEYRCYRAERQSIREWRARAWRERTPS